MKKVVVTSFLACAVTVSGLSSAFAQDASGASTQTAPAATQTAPAATQTAPAATQTAPAATQTAPAAAQGTAGGAQAGSPTAAVQMPAAEYTVYQNAEAQTDPKAKAAAFEAYLTQYPQSAVKATVLGTLMALYVTFDTTKALDAADRLLQADPTSVKALYVETFLRNQQAAALTDASAKQTAMDAVAGYAQKGLAAPRPVGMSAEEFETLTKSEYPVFYSAVGYDALLKKDMPTAIDNYKKELALVPEAATQTPGPVLQDIYFLAAAYYQSTPPDYLNCTFYASRVAAYAPENLKSQYAPTAKYCYKKYHGGDDGYDAVVAAATANLNPPAGLFDSIKPAPTPAEQIHKIISTTPDLATLAIEDKETIFQNGSADDAAKVWDSIKGKSVTIPGALVIESSPGVLKVAVSPDAVQSKTADFTFNLKDDDTGTAAHKAAIAAATAVGQTVTLTGTYTTFTQSPVMIVMNDGEVVLAKAKPAARSTARTAARRRAR